VSVAPPLLRPLLVILPGVGHLDSHNGVQQEKNARLRRLPLLVIPPRVSHPDTNNGVQPKKNRLCSIKAEIGLLLLRVTVSLAIKSQVRVPEVGDLLRVRLLIIILATKEGIIVRPVRHLFELQMFLLWKHSRLSLLLPCHALR